MRRITLSATVAFCLSSFVAASADAQGQKFADTVCGIGVGGEIKAPPPGADPSLARYLGVWTGSSWKPGVCNGLVVSEVTPAGNATATVAQFPSLHGPTSIAHSKAQRLQSKLSVFFDRNT